MSIHASLNQPNPVYTIAQGMVPTYNSSPAARFSPIAHTPTSQVDVGFEKFRAEMQKMIYENFGIEPKQVHVL
jgi:hypothetical protein